MHIEDECIVKIIDGISGIFKPYLADGIFSLLIIGSILKPNKDTKQNDLDFVVIIEDYFSPKFIVDISKKIDSFCREFDEEDVIWLCKDGPWNPPKKEGKTYLVHLALLTITDLKNRLQNQKNLAKSQYDDCMIIFGKHPYTLFDPPKIRICDVTNSWAGIYWLYSAIYTQLVLRNGSIEMLLNSFQKINQKYFSWHELKKAYVSTNKPINEYQALDDYIIKISALGEMRDEY